MTDTCALPGYDRLGEEAGRTELQDQGGSAVEFRLVAGPLAEIADSFFTPAVNDLVPYEPGKPVEEVQRELGLDRVVKLEMVADVPLGSFLSGGIDSSAIVAMMERHSNGRRVGTTCPGYPACGQRLGDVKRLRVGLPPRPARRCEPVRSAPTLA